MLCREAWVLVQQMVTDPNLLPSPSCTMITVDDELALPKPSPGDSPLTMLWKGTGQGRLCAI